MFYWLRSLWDLLCHRVVTFRHAFSCTVGTLYIQAGTYTQSRSLALHHSTLRSLVHFCLMSISVLARDTNSVVICCCPHRDRARGSPRKKNQCMYTCKCLHVCIRMPLRNSPNLNHSTLQLTAERLWQCHKSQLVNGVHIQNTRSTVNIKQGNTPTAKHESFLFLFHQSSTGLGFGLMFGAIIWTNCLQF